MMEAGSTIDGRYCLVSLIGEGGMASVWRAEDQNLKRAVAIKLLYLGAQRDPSVAVEQFLREARIAAAVQHRNVIHTMDFGTTSEGVPYMVMELLQGETLAARMQREPALRVHEWIRIAEMMLRGLAAVHDAGIVHRDLKPQNIFLQRDSDGVYPKILDFGISRSSGSQQLASPITTQRGFVIGTPHYMAPEQACGDGQIDHRADLYSVGTILYEGLAGRLPFDADATPDLLRKIISSDPVALRELVPKNIELIAECVSQAMSRNRDERFGNARAFRNALTRAHELSFPSEVSSNRSELPMEPANLPNAAAPQNDVRAAWGDFEGLAGRAGARERKDASVPLAAAVQREPGGPLAASSRERKDVSVSLGTAGRREPSGAQMPGRRDPSGPLATSPRERKDASVPLGAAARRDPSGPLVTSPRERKDASVPLGAAARRDPSGPLVTSPRERKDVSVPLGAAARRAPSGSLVTSPRERKDASVPLGAAASGGGEPVPRARKLSSSQQDAVRAPVPDAAISYPGEGPMLGDNPLDAFAGSAAVSLELDYAPWQERRPEDAEVKEKQPVQQMAVAAAQREVPAATRSARTGSLGDANLWWLLPAVLLLLFVLFLLAPNLLSMAPPDDAAAQVREAESAATRGSSRVLQRQRVEVVPSARPEQRELVE
jgi:serine/threonine-protein kinase